MSNSGALDTAYRPALRRLLAAGRLRTYDAVVDPDLEAAAILKRLDGGPAILFPQVAGHTMPVLGNLLCCEANVEAAFGVDFRSLRALVGQAINGPIPPRLTTDAPAQHVVHTHNLDLGALLPALRHTAADSGRFITAGIIIVRDPDSGIYNASYHRLQLLGGARTAIKLDYGRHLRQAFERAQRRGVALPVAIVLGADLALHYTAATMGSQMPDTADELAVAGGLSGRALPVARAITQDLLIPAEAEIILEGTIAPDEFVEEGPFGEFVGFLSPPGQAPVFTATAVTHRAAPIYQAINGYGRETVMLRKYVLEASLLRVLQAAVPIVTDAEMTAGGMHRFHAVIQLRKTMPQHDGLQRNAILAAFGALKDLDLVIAVDDDIDLRDPADVEYALASRMEASRDLIVIPAARGHEYVRIGADGIRAKLGIDATVPYADRARFARCEFLPVDAASLPFTDDRAAAVALLHD